MGKTSTKCCFDVRRRSVSPLYTWRWWCCCLIYVSVCECVRHRKSDEVELGVKWVIQLKCWQRGTRNLSAYVCFWLLSEEFTLYIDAPSGVWRIRFRIIFIYSMFGEWRDVEILKQNIPSEWYRGKGKIHLLIRKYDVCTYQFVFFSFCFSFVVLYWIVLAKWIRCSRCSRRRWCRLFQFRYWVGPLYFYMYLSPTHLYFFWNWTTHFLLKNKRITNTDNSNNNNNKWV